MHHMTANWCPTARDERDMLCFGVWGTVGSTGRWPEVVNLWELNGWDGLVANFAHELASPSLQDPALAKWWAVAAELRRGGFDRMSCPNRGARRSRSSPERACAGVVYAHEIVRVPIGTVRAFLETLADVGRARARAARAALRRRVPRRDDQRHRGDRDLGASVVGSVGRLRAGLGRFRSSRRGGPGSSTLNADVQRTLLVDAPLSPMRTGRQPQVEDRRPLDEL